MSLAIVQLPLVTLGARQETLFLFNALMGLQGLLSHFNVDIKAGPLNYLLVGAELHRFHHGADLDEAKNFGVLTPFWDLVFGTFRYDARRLPNALGVINPEQYPASTAIGKVMMLPFRPQANPRGDAVCGLRGMSLGAAFPGQASRTVLGGALLESHLMTKRALLFCLSSVVTRATTLSPFTSFTPLATSLSPAGSSLASDLTPPLSTESLPVSLAVGTVSPWSSR